jgi:hypothetical protein
LEARPHGRLSVDADDHGRLRTQPPPADLSPRTHQVGALSAARSCIRRFASRCLQRAYIHLQSVTMLAGNALRRPLCLFDSTRINLERARGFEPPTPTLAKLPAGPTQGFWHDAHGLPQATNTSIHLRSVDHHPATGIQQAVHNWRTPAMGWIRDQLPPEPRCSTIARGSHMVAKKPEGPSHFQLSPSSYWWSQPGSNR